VNKLYTILSTSYFGDMADIKIVDVLERYDGTACVEEWLQRFDILCQIKEIKEEDQAAILGMLLRGPAMARFAALDADQRKKVDDVKDALRGTLGLTPLRAYEELVARRCGPDERPEVYLMDLRRLATLAGGVNDTLLKSVFIVGLPHEVSRLMRSETTADLNELIKKATALMEQRPTETVAVAWAGNSAKREAHKMAPKTRSKIMACFRCGGPHMARFCESGNIECWRCGKRGHVAKKCPEAGNERGSAPAPGAPRAEQ
jgi:Zinc knuckle